MAKSVFEKIWDQHVVVEREDGDVLLYIDRHLTHDLHFRAFDALKAKGLSIKEPNKLFGVPDHSVPTTAKTLKDVVAEVYDSGMRTAHKLAYPDEKWCPDALSRLLRSSRLVPGYVFALQPFPLGVNTLTPLNPFLSLPYLGLALIGLDPKDKSVINMQNLSDGMCDEGEEDKQCN